MSQEPRPTEQELAIALVYAEALLGLAEEAGQSEAMMEELDALRVALDRQPSFESFLTSPLVDAEERRLALERIFRGRMSDLLLDALQVMNRKGRAGLARVLIEAYRGRLEELRGQVRVRVKTAVSLSGALRARLQVSVSEYTGKRALLEESLDETLIGGVVLQIGDRKIDSSVGKELRKLGRQLLERASREIHHGRTYIEDVT